MKGLALEICEKPGRNRVFTKKIKGFHTEKQILLEVKRPDYFWYRITGFPGVIGPMRNPFVTAFMALWPWGFNPYHPQSSRPKLLRASNTEPATVGAWSISTNQIHANGTFYPEH